MNKDTNKDESVNYSQYTRKRIDKLSHLTREQQDALFKEMTLSDNDLKASKAEHKQRKSNVAKDAIDTLRHYDNTINEDQKHYDDNRKGSVKSALFDKNIEGVDNKKEYLVQMFFTLNKRHKNYEEEKSTYTAEQLAVVHTLEKESGGKVKFIVDTNFLKAFNKLMGVSYRGAAILGKYVVVGDPKDLAVEGLLRHEAIHCAQQRNMGMMPWLILSLASKIGKQFMGPERFTSSAVDYGTDNQATDLETYMNQFNPEYLQKRPKFGHRKYYNKDFLQTEYKRIAQEELEEMKKIGAELTKKQQNGGLSRDEEDQLENNSRDIQQFEKMMEYIQDDEENRVVLVEPDVLASKANKNSDRYDPKAQVWTETKKNRDIRIAMEKNLEKTTIAAIEAKKEKVAQMVGESREKEELEQTIKEYEIFLSKITNNQDKSRRKIQKDMPSE